MPLTNEELAARRQGIGASDVAAILGEDKYRNRSDVYAEKVYKVEQSTSEAADLGNYLESGAIAFGAEKIGLEAITTGLLREVEGTAIRANLDAYVIEDGQEIPLEAKAVGILHPHGVDEEWGDEWSADIPSQYVLQLTTQMMAVGAPYGYLTAVIGGKGHRVYKVPYREKIAEIIRKACAEFWALVEAETPPDDWAPSEDVLKRISRIDGEIIGGGPAMVQAVIRWKAMNKAAKAAKAEEDDAKAAVIAMLGDAEAASIDWMTTEEAVLLAEALGEDPEKACLKTAVKYLSQNRTDIDRSKMKKEYPEAYAACVSVGSHRVLRLTKPPKGFEVTKG